MKIGIASGKGGTGKTFLAVNLASYLAQYQKITLVDMDVEEPNSGLFLNNKPHYIKNTFKMIPKWDEESCKLCGECQQVCNFNAIKQLDTLILVFPELCHSCYACSELCSSSALPMIPLKMGEIRHSRIGNLIFVEGILEIGQELAVPQISKTNKYVDEQFQDDRIIIYDCPPGTSCPVIESTRSVDYVILITEPTPFGLHDLKLAVETMRSLKKHFGVVINRDGSGNNDVFYYCRKEDIEIIARIPDIRRIAEIYSHGELVYSRIPEVEIQIEVIARHILHLKDQVIV